jgi:hypothetical protein
VIKIFFELHARQSSGTLEPSQALR